MNPARGRHGTRQKGEGSARFVGVGVTISMTVIDMTEVKR